jgi:hypothetical protein
VCHRRVARRKTKLAGEPGRHWLDVPPSRDAHVRWLGPVAAPRVVDGGFRFASRGFRSALAPSLHLSGSPPTKETAMTELSFDVLSTVTGGAGVSQSWQQIRQQAAPHCPQTVAAHPAAPKTRSQAQAIGNQCIAEMGSFKAAMGGREKIQEGIDGAFPR